ncbi:hypothetical protein ISR94_02095 [Candidatus Microgenomates bacterium]|nr:hypothetical protein [Candidatus Microgenomates bacterium]
MKSPIEYIKQAISIYTQKENFIFFAKIMAVLTIVATLLGLLMGYLYPADVYETLDFSNLAYTMGFIVLSLIVSIFGVFVRSTTLVSVINTGGDVKGVFGIGYKKIWKYLIVTMVVGLIVFLGGLLLIIPGIMFAVWFSFSTLLVIDKELKVKEALRQSKEMVSGRFWKVLGRFFVFGLFVIVVAVIFDYIPYAGSIIVSFLSPLFILPSYLLYKDLTV